jgi:hypothetical protein
MIKNNIFRLSDPIGKSEIGNFLKKEIIKYDNTKTD